MRHRNRAFPHFGLATVATRERGLRADLVRALAKPRPLPANGVPLPCAADAVLGLAVAQRSASR